MVVSAVANVAMVIGSHKNLFSWNKYLYKYCYVATNITQILGQILKISKS